VLLWLVLVPAAPDPADPPAPDPPDVAPADSYLSVSYTSYIDLLDRGTPTFD